MLQADELGFGSIEVDNTAVVSPALDEEYDKASNNGGDY